MRAKACAMAAVLAVMFGVTSAGAREQLYYFHNDHLGTPQAMSDASGRKVWEAEYDPFGKATVNHDPDGDGRVAVNNLRFPGQYYDAETGLHYNYHRDYDPATGRYLQPDPIGLVGGPNVYSYVYDNPLSYADPFGLDVNVCYYSDAAAGAGHIGYGFPGEQGTTGFYPTGNPFGSPGVVKDDTQKEKSCKTVESPPEKDKCMLECRESWKAKPGTYTLTGRQCTTFVRECLKKCGLPTSVYSGPEPRVFYNYMQGN